MKRDITEIDREDFRNLLKEIAGTHMPFGKYGRKAFPPKGYPIHDLPIEYLGWFKQQGFPKGRLGELLEQVYEIKSAGMDVLFEPMREINGGRMKFHPERPKHWRLDED